MEKVLYNGARVRFNPDFINNFNEYEYAFSLRTKQEVMTNHTYDVSTDDIFWYFSFGNETVLRFYTDKFDSNGYYNGIQVFISAQKTQLNFHCCSLCGSRGDDLVFAFYCSNINCRNYKE